MNMDWTPPEPRTGLLGAWDRFIGPGATPAELRLQIITTLAAALAVPVYAAWRELGWSAVQMGVAALLAFDLAGGVVTNATAAAKRWYHRPGQGFAQHIGFVVVHVHPFVVAWLFQNEDWTFAVLVYGYLLVAAVVILRMPLYLRRPVAMSLYVVGALMPFYILVPASGLEWFVPVYYLKLLVSHLLKEIPFSPEPPM